MSEEQPQTEEEIETEARSEKQILFDIENMLKEIKANQEKLMEEANDVGVKADKMQSSLRGIMDRVM